MELSSKLLLVFFGIVCFGIGMLMLPSIIMANNHPEEYVGMNGKTVESNSGNSGSTPPVQGGQFTASTDVWFILSAVAALVVTVIGLSWMLISRNQQTVTPFTPT